MRLVVARCQVDYAGRLTAHLPMATRLLMVKNDGSVLVHSDGGSYKPLNWMSPPCTLETVAPDDEQQSAGIVEVWKVTHKKTADQLVVSIHEVLHDSAHELGVDPGLQKDGVEAHLQQLLAGAEILLDVALNVLGRQRLIAPGNPDFSGIDFLAHRFCSSAPWGSLRAHPLQYRMQTKL